MMENVLLVVIILVVIVGAAVLIYRDWRKKPAPKLNPVQVFSLGLQEQCRVYILPGCPPWVEQAVFEGQVNQLLNAVYCVTRTMMKSVDITFEFARRKCGRVWANGCYGPAHGPDRPAGIWVSVGYSREWSDKAEDMIDFAPGCFADTALLHEALHHATGFTDAKDSARLAEMEQEVRRLWDDRTPTDFIERQRENPE
jgi:hypothetical protein